MGIFLTLAEPFIWLVVTGNFDHHFEVVLLRRTEDFRGDKVGISRLSTRLKARSDQVGRLGFIGIRRHASLEHRI